MDFNFPKKLILLLLSLVVGWSVGFSQSTNCDILDYQTLHVKKRFLSKNYSSPKFMSLGELRTLRFNLKKCYLEADSLFIEYEILANPVSINGESLVNIVTVEKFDLIFSNIVKVENYKESNKIKKILLRKKRKVKKAGTMNSSNILILPFEEEQFNLIFSYKDNYSLFVRLSVN